MLWISAPMPDDMGMATKDSVQQTGVIKHPPGALTLPCNLNQLNEWLKDAHSTASGGIAGSSVTGTTTSLSVV
jgi:hypothetical protein